MTRCIGFAMYDTSVRCKDCRFSKPVDSNEFNVDWIICNYLYKSTCDCVLDKDIERTCNHFLPKESITMKPSCLTCINYGIHTYCNTMVFCSNYKRGITCATCIYCTYFPHANFSCHDYRNTGITRIDDINKLRECNYYKPIKELITMNKFCEHQSCESYQTPRCTAYIFNNEHPLCAYKDEKFADYNCKAFKKVEQPKTLEQVIETLTDRLDKLECKMDKTLLIVKHIIRDGKQ